MIKQIFFIGNEWLYYKIYCGHKTADLILSEVIKPVTKQLKTNKEIDKWFFIRYGDPKNHLRIRFHLINKNSIVAVTNLLHEMLEDYIKADLIWKVTVDTYQREIERYGKNTTELAEDLFCNDSVLTTDIISMLEGDEGETIRWQIALRSVDEFINDFKYNLKSKYELLNYMKDSFAKEYHMNKSLKIQLGDKFRKYRKLITNILTIENDDKSDFKPIFNLIKERSIKNKTIVDKILKLNENGELEKPLNEFMWSYLHMLNNRFFRSKQRTHELVIYYLLYNHYRSVLARTGMKMKKQ